MPINQKIWRYREAISFFSFNCIDNFNEYLWLKNDKLEESKEICRYYLNKWIMNNDYFYEFFKFLKPIFKELSIKCGPTFFRSLISWMDNVFIERLWRSVKYEEVYLKGYDSIRVARQELKAYFDFYNRRGRHYGLAKQFPDEVYLNNQPLKIAA